MATVTITTEYITLGQLLKDAGVIDSGGAAKWFLAENRVLVNGEADTRRGRKLRVGDSVTLPDGTQVAVAQAE
ncbi:S4 domain-containing protein YaaA [Lacticaseibacillus baoqingensis]|jgi:S4 domain protein YaaA|uniref:S4 domain-containing protein YaaA n=1 Tax=Lacticaseibacillus baoqingensis TaxID=2486013 RepID=A0ABW4E9A0_9LACO|nr:S4 domain-containing protein YaaA [Lacticaseibacillus baoqingensis]MCI1986202.1 S4 domain-containing protein YaaA [Lactobacillus sp.]MCI2032519.1 S4 domain-containing protein YaaA [Lactobacillus sp.]